MPVWLGNGYTTVFPFHTFAPFLILFLLFNSQSCGRNCYPTLKGEQHYGQNYCVTCIEYCNIKIFKKLGAK